MQHFMIRSKTSPKVLMCIEGDLIMGVWIHPFLNTADKSALRR